MKEVGYIRTSKNKKEEIKLVVGTRRRHTREKYKYRLKSKSLNNHSLLNEVIFIEEQPTELQTEDYSIKKFRKSLKM